jgi:uncharacterized protein YdaU (DUF1376 family)
MSKRPWYKRYGGDFVMGTMSLSLEEKGAYSLCLDLIYDRGGPIPDDARWLAGVCGVSLRKWATLRDRLIATGKLSPSDGFLTNQRASAMLAADAEAREEQAENGAKGGRKRAENASKTLPISPEKQAIPKENSVLVQGTPKPTQKLEPLPESKTDAEASSVAGSDVAKAFAEWNALAKRLALPVAKGLTPERRKAIRARLATDGLIGWREALAAVEASPHCRGENDRGWRADIDFVASPTKFQKLREGSYGPVPAGPADSTKPAATFDAPAVRASMVKASDEDFVRRYVDHYCRWVPDGRRLEAQTPAIQAALTKQLGAWATRNTVTIALMSANDTPPLFAEGEAA